MFMLRRLFALTIALLLVGPMSAWGQLPANELEGTWKMVKQERVYPDSTVDYTDKWGTGFKILNSTHFSWGRETQNGEVLSGGGWYEYYPKENTYIEHIQYHTDSGLAGLTLKFTAKIDGDTWVHIGDVQDYKLREVWKRVDPDSISTMRAEAMSEEAGSKSTASGQ